MEYKDLQMLDLSVNESKVYFSLLEYGEAKAIEISRNSLVSSSKIYEVLDSLEKKGLVEIIPEKVKLFKATPVSQAIETLERKRIRIEELKKSLETFKRKTRNEKNIVIFKGRRNFHDYVKFRSGKEKKKSFSYGIKWKADIVDKNITRRVVEAIDECRDIKHLFDYNVEKQNYEYWKKIIPDIKFIRSNGVAMDISDSEVMISMVELDLTVLIYSKDLVEVMKQLFEGYWKAGGEKK